MMMMKQGKISLRLQGTGKKVERELMDGAVPKIFYNFYLNFMNFLIFLNSRGAGSKFPQGGGGPDLWSGGAGPPAATPLVSISQTPHFKVT